MQKEQQKTIDYSQYKERNSFAFWTLILILFVLALGNLSLTATIISVLKLGNGLENMELINTAETVKFFGSIDFDRLYKKNGKLEGFYDEPVTITGEKSSVVINLSNKNTGHPQIKMHMGRNGTQFRGINQFEVKESVGQGTKSIFSTQRPTYNIPNAVRNLKANIVSTSRVTSPLEEPLKLETKNKLTLRGIEGIHMESKELIFKSDQNILLKTLNDSIFLTSSNGVYINIDRLPVVQSQHGILTENLQYKLCVCMPQGRIFRIAIPKNHGIKGSSCTHFNPKYDPCA